MGAGVVMRGCGGLRTDITCHPCNGKFKEKQKGIHNAVFKSSKSVMAAVKPVEWG